MERKRPSRENSKNSAERPKMILLPATPPGGVSPMANAPSPRDFPIRRRFSRENGDRCSAERPRMMMPSPMSPASPPPHPPSPMPPSPPKEAIADDRIAYGKPLAERLSNEAMPETDGDTTGTGTGPGVAEMKTPNRASENRPSAEVAAADEEKKLARLKKKVAIKALEQLQKQKKASEIRRKPSEAPPSPAPARKKSSVNEHMRKKPSRVASKNERNRKKKPVGEKIKEKFRAFSNIFATEKVQKNAQAKINGNRMAHKLQDGDDVMPMTMPRMREEDDEDVWIDDPAALKMKDHRPDLVLVHNNDNNGQLFHEGKRPFWKNKAFAKEVPPPPAEKAVSKLLMKVVREEIPLADPMAEPELDFCDDLDELMAKDDKWFKEENILGNTIRSIVGTLDTQTMALVPAAATEPLQMIEPLVTTCYLRHKLVITKQEPFKKSAPGKPKRLRRQSSSGSTSGSEK